MPGGVGGVVPRGVPLSRSPAHPAPGSQRRSPPSPHLSSVAGAVSQSGLPRDGNCAHQLANYLAHDPPASINKAGSPHPCRPAQGGDQAPLTHFPPVIEDGGIAGLKGSLLSIIN